MDEQHRPRHGHGEQSEAIVTTIAGGGSYAFGFALGVATGLASEGIDLRSGPIVGTSGGSHAAVAIGAQLTFDEVEAIWTRYIETAGKFWVRAIELTEQLYGGVEVDDVAGVAIRLRWFKRMLLWSDEVRPADLVAASSSPFPFVRPHKIGKHRFIDGGHRSNSSADIAPPAELHVVLAPFATRQQGLIGRLAARQIPKETAKWRASTGGATMVVTPDDAMYAVKVRGMKDLGDMRIGRRIYELAVPIGVECAATLRRDHPDVVTRLGPAARDDAAG